MACFRISWVLVQCTQIQMTVWIFSPWFLFWCFKQWHWFRSQVCPGFYLAPTEIFRHGLFASHSFYCTTITLSTITCFGCICAADLVFCRLCCDVTVHRSEKSTSLRQSDIPWRQHTSASTVFPASLPCYHTLCTMHVSIYAEQTQRVWRKVRIRRKEECDKTKYTWWVKQ